MPGGHDSSLHDVHVHVHVDAGIAARCSDHHSNAASRESSGPWEDGGVFPDRIHPSACSVIVARYRFERSVYASSRIAEPPGDVRYSASPSSGRSSSCSAGRTSFEASAPRLPLMGGGFPPFSASTWPTIGGPRRARTDDPGIKSPLLYQLS